MELQQQQFFNLLLLLLLGMFFSDFYLAYYEVGAIFAFTLTLSALLNYPYQEKFFIHYSSFSTTIGVILLMVTTHLWIYGTVILLGLLQKRYLRVEGKHFFNPSNFALAISLFLFYDEAHLLLGQLSYEVWLVAILVVVAVSILIRANRWVISLSFVLFYFLFQYLLVIDYNPILLMEDVYYRFYSIAFILFVCFMLTDPKVTPHAYQHQVIFAFLIALVGSLLDRYYGFRVQHLFLVLFGFSPLVWLFEKPSKKLAIASIVLGMVALTIIIIIETKVPYYFSMSS